MPPIGVSLNVMKIENQLKAILAILAYCFD